MIPDWFNLVGPALAIINIILLILDMLQTNQILENPKRWSEKNALNRKMYSKFGPKGIVFTYLGWIGLTAGALVVALGGGPETAVIWSLGFGGLAVAETINVLRNRLKGGIPF